MYNFFALGGILGFTLKKEQEPISYQQIIIKKHIVTKMIIIKFLVYLWFVNEIPTKLTLLAACKSMAGTASKFMVDPYQVFLQSTLILFNS